MLPSLIQRKLWGLRLWEASLRLVWGAARWLVLALALLALACTTDWLIDRFFQTPWPLRVALLIGQLAVGVTAAALLLLRPLVVRLSNNHLALLVEDHEPELNHRLISVVQFHQPGARLEGMSRELIDRVTAETKERVADVNFAAKADSRRLLWGLSSVAPAVLLALGLYLLWPETVWALIQRQWLANVGIPRSIYLEAASPEVWPQGEEVVLRFRVRGPGLANLELGDSQGVLRLDPEGQPSETYPLKLEAIDPETGEAIAVAVLPPSYTNGEYRAWLLDGRLEEPGQLRYEPRPVIESIHTWAVLPPKSFELARALVVVPGSGGVWPVACLHCNHEFDLRPVPVWLPGSGGLWPVPLLHCQYEFPRGEVVAVDGWSARVTIKAQKPIRKATLQLLGPKPLLENPMAVAGTVGWACTGLEGGSLSLLPCAAGAVQAAKRPTLFFGGYETILQEIDMSVLPEGDSAQSAPFTLPAGGAGYRLIVEDEYAFKNIPAPRRTIRFVAEEPPQVALLPERMPADQADEDGGQPAADAIDGAPVRSGKRFWIAYHCRGPLGLGKATLHYRVLKKAVTTSENSAEGVETTPWTPLPLAETLAAPNSGPFNAKLGTFRNSDLKTEEVEFHAVPIIRPQRWLGRLEGGGRFTLKLKGLTDGRGGFYEPRPGDQIEFYIEVFASKNTNADRPRAVSEVHSKRVVTPQEFVNWMRQEEDRQRRLQQLEQEQKGQKGAFGFN